MNVQNWRKEEVKHDVEEGASLPLQDNQTNIKATVSSNLDAGVYIDSKLNGLNTKMLVDIGATVTLVSHQLVYALPLKQHPYQQTVNQRIMSANRTEINIAGEGLFLLKTYEEQIKIEI